ncbi:AAA domain-containing protein [Sphingomonas sp. MAH-6]|nr:AAA domain-containing protein [Sphingomonas chungangi]
MAAINYFTLGLKDVDPVQGTQIGTIDRTPPTGSYRPSDGLRKAVDTALILGKPLLLMGPPGTGKTQLAPELAANLSCAFRKFETKSTSEARDLFYTYDNLSAFKSGTEPFDARQFITFQALGTAILDAFPRDHPRVEALLGLADDKKGDGKARLRRRTVVLIDEIDKAPRDFPNDLLNEIDRLYFKVPELGNAISPGGEGDAIDPKYRPIVIITSNDERGLPAAFLRRCLFFYIEFPTEEEMREIVTSALAHRLNLKPGDDLPVAIRDAVALFYKLRGRASTEGPSTAELIDWLELLLVRRLDPKQPLARQAGGLIETIEIVLAKTVDAQRRIAAELKTAMPKAG